MQFNLFPSSSLLLAGAASGERPWTKRKRRGNDTPCPLDETTEGAVSNALLHCQRECTVPTTTMRQSALGLEFEGELLVLGRISPQSFVGSLYLYPVSLRLARLISSVGSTTDCLRQVIRDGTRGTLCKVDDILNSLGSDAVDLGDIWSLEREETSRGTSKLSILSFVKSASESVCLGFSCE